jgi:hypothetical protein
VFLIPIIIVTLVDLVPQFRTTSVCFQMFLGALAAYRAWVA